MPAYWVARAKVNDAKEYKRYTDLVPGIIQKFGGNVMARGGRFTSLEEPQKFERHIVIEFPSFEDAVACHQSTEYQEARKYRLNGVGENELIIVDGDDATT